MDDAVRALDVGGGDGGAVNFDTLGGVNLDHSAVDSRSLRELDDVAGHHLAGDDMVCQDAGELVFVFGKKKIVQRALGELGEGVIGGGEDGEGAIALEGVHEASGAEGGGEGRKAAGSDGGVDDVLHLRLLGGLFGGGFFRGSSANRRARGTAASRGAGGGGDHAGGRHGGGEGGGHLEGGGAWGRVGARGEVM